MLFAHVVTAWLIKSCSLLFCFTFMCVMLGLYVDYSSSAVEQKCTVWHAYLLRGICQLCKMYVYLSSCSHC